MKENRKRWVPLLTCGLFCALLLSGCSSMMQSVADGTDAVLNGLAEGADQIAGALADMTDAALDAAADATDDSVKDAILDAMTKYGKERGRRMALNAQTHGDPLNTMTNQAYGEWKPD